MSSFDDVKVAERLGIVKVHPDTAVKQLILAWRARMPICFLGPTGQGKSAAISEAARQLHVLAMQDQLDWRVPCELHNWKVQRTYETTYRRIAEDRLVSSDVGFELITTNPSTKDAFDYTGLAKVDDETGIQSYYRPASLPSDPYMLGMWQITEMNRPAAKRSIRPLLDVFQSRIIDEHVIPAGINIVADFNEGDIYDTEQILDPFFIRRASFLFLENDFSSWRSWMKKRHMGDLVTRFLDANPALFDNDEARKNAQVYACAATWTRVQEIVDTLLPHAAFGDFYPLLAGMVRREVAQKLYDFVKKGTKLNPRHLLENYSKERHKVLDFRSRGHGVDYIPSAAYACVDVLKNLSPDDPFLDTALPNFAAFFGDMPLEVAQGVVMEILPDLNATGQVEDKTRDRLHDQLISNPISRVRMLDLMQIVSACDSQEAGGALAASGQKS